MKLQGSFPPVREKGDDEEEQEEEVEEEVKEEE